MGMCEVIDARQHRVGPHFAIGEDAAHGNTAETDTVIATLATDEARTRGLTASAVVRKSDLERRVDRIRTGVCEEHVVETCGCDLYELVRQLKHNQKHKQEGRCVV